MRRLKSLPRLDSSLNTSILIMLSSSIIPLFLTFKDDTLSGYKGWLMNNIDPNITLGYRDVMVTDGGRRIGYSWCKYASSWISLPSPSSLASVMILFVCLLLLSCWPFWNLARQGTNASPLRKGQQRVVMATRIMHYSMKK
jgi:hypothetical protein